jgi:prevent-host-death family protein
MASPNDRIVTIHEAKTHLSRLLADVEAGKGVIIARGRQPVARLVPFLPKAKRVPGTLKGRIDIAPGFFEPMPDEELALWYGDDRP